MKKITDLEKFLSEHKIYRFNCNADQGFSFFIDGVSYKLDPLYAGSSGMARNYPSGYEVYRKKKGEDREFLFEYFDFGDSPNALLYDEIVKKLKIENPDYKVETHFQYIIWKMIERMEE